MRRLFVLLTLLAGCATPDRERPTAGAYALGILGQLAVEYGVSEYGDMDEIQPGVYRQP